MRFAFCLLLLAGPVFAQERVLSVGGSVTEIIYALGQEDRLVARDSTGTYPPEAEDLPNVGYMRALSPEGVLSVRPDLVIAEDGAGPPETLEVLAGARIPIIFVPDDPSPAGILEKIAVVGDALDVPDQAEILARDVEKQLAEAGAYVEDLAEETPPRVLFILSAQGGRIMAGGDGTGAEAIIELAGGENALTGVEGYKPLSDEAVVAAAPEVILMMDRDGDHSAADEELFAMPALAGSPAASDGRVIRMDGLYLLGFGPRTAEAVRDLAAAMHGS
ncbi:MAG: ABC transporter substrate-binding protein [Pseudomonadota bacterium]